MLHLFKFPVKVANVSSGTATGTRTLLALLATTEQPLGWHADRSLESLCCFDEVMVYFHGFPDMAVHPTKMEFASRMPQKLAEAWLQAAPLSSQREQKRSVAFVTFNFGGIPGSDEELCFTEKTISKEVEDAIAVSQFIKQHLFRSQTRGGRVHLVGLSTGAIIASLLRVKMDAVYDTVAVIAGLLDLQRGISYDFSPIQLEQFARDGTCWKEFYLPDDCPLPKNVDLSFDGEHIADVTKQDEVPKKLYIRLNKRYIDECQDGSLDIAASVASPTMTTLPPLLVIHGDADQNVPFADGKELFETANEPKTFVEISKANHLLTNSKHLKRALKAILAHCCMHGGDARA